MLGRGWTTQLLQSFCNCCSRQPHWPGFPRKIFCTLRVCKAWGGKLQDADHRKPQENSCQGQEHAQEEKRLGCFPEQERQLKPPQLSEMEWKEHGESMEQMPEASRVEWRLLAGKGEPWNQIFALPPGWKSLQRETRPNQ